MDQERLRKREREHNATQEKQFSTTKKVKFDQSKSLTKSSRKAQQHIKEQLPDRSSPNKKSIIVTRGVHFVPVDNYFPMKEKAKVIQIQKSFYSITLTQSNLAKDDNKFFIIQALQIGQPSLEEYYLFTRWGRVGVPGQTKCSEFPLTHKEVIRQYNVKSQDKVNCQGYKIIQVNYQQGRPDRKDEQIKTQFGQSRLPQKLQQLVKLIFDRKMMNFHMKEIGYDQKRSPLGLMATKSIEKGYISLDNIMKVLKNQIELKSQSQKKQLLNQYSGQFYSAIPHDFGYLKMQAFVLNTQQKVKQKLDMLSSLSQIQIYSQQIRERSSHPQMCDIDVKYLKLHCQISPLQSAQAYNWIKRYIENTHASTHDKYVIQLMDIFQVKRQEETAKYRYDIPNKMILWHGSRLSNYVGILSQGLKIAPFQAPATGYMFGKGVYFTDIVSKSANYCRPKDQSQGLMLLCQVALGQMNNKVAADFNAHKLPEGYHSTKGVGKFAPNSGECIDNVFIPNGILAPVGTSSSLLYNEYVVYNRDQILCRYIVHVKFKFK